MSRTDRLYDLTQELRGGEIHRGEDLASSTGVSLRTIYRDIETLRASGLPIEGTRGEGYRMTAAIPLPGLTLTQSELEAMHLGLAIIGEAADTEMQEAALSLSAKVDAVLPENTQDARSKWGFAVHPYGAAGQSILHLPPLRAAIRARQKVQLSYTTRSEINTLQTVRPLQLEYWGRLWTLTAWCEQSAGFRVFRVERISEVKPMPALFVDERGKRLEDYDPIAAHRSGV
ncbi:MAG: YafY family protein [Pseudomonadota bacterium]